MGADPNQKGLECRPWYLGEENSSDNDTETSYDDSQGCTDDDDDGDDEQGSHGHIMGASLINPLHSSLSGIRHRKKHASSTDDAERCETHPLQVACISGNLSIVNRLLDAGANINQEGYWTRTALHTVALTGNEEIAAYLLSCSEIDVNRSTSARSWISEGATPFFYACLKGHTNVVQLFLNNPDVDVNQTNANKDRGNPFLAACAEGHFEVVKLLLANRRVNVHATDGNGRSALFNAVCAGNLSVVKLLLNYRAEGGGGGGGSSSADIAGESSRANGLEHQPFVKANLDAGSNGDDTHAAVDTNSNSPAPDITHAAATATAVGNSRINLNQARAEDGCTPLFAACCAVDAQQIVQALVDHGAAETWAPNHHGETPLTAACSSDNVGYARTLLHTGQFSTMDMNNRVTKGEHQGMNVLHCAAYVGNRSMGELLAVFGADLSANQLHIFGNPENLDYFAGMFMEIGDAGEVASMHGHTTRAFKTWFTAVKGWTPLQVAAGCRLHRDAAVALRLGHIAGGRQRYDGAAPAEPKCYGDDYGDGDGDGDGGGSKVAIGKASTSNGWWPEATVVQEMLESVSIARTGPADLPWGEAQPVCHATIRLMQSVLRGWWPTTHWLHHRGVRNAVCTMLLVAERLRRRSNVAGDCAAVVVVVVGGVESVDVDRDQEKGGKSIAVGSLPALPAEIIFCILSWICRSFWAVEY